MKLSDYVASFLADLGIRHVFTLAGGASLHLIHSIADTPGITYVCTQHEQAAAMAADAYSRATGNLGAAIATSGPGATNLLTGVCCSYFDSVPTIYITGQLASYKLKGDAGVRQIGFQETDITGIFRPVTKYVVQILDPSRIGYELGKACYLAKSGRPGPVLLDIPDDIQRQEIDPEELDRFVPPPANSATSHLEDYLEQCTELLKNARRPVVIFGWGVHLANAEKQAREFADRLGFPVLLTRSTLDMFPSTHPLAAGTFGVQGTRYGNFIVQNADLVLAIGTRLDTQKTGGLPKGFAREARKIIVDIDPTELSKFEEEGMTVDVLVQADAKDFLQSMIPRLPEVIRENLSEWNERVAAWKVRYPECPADYYEEEQVNPYVFVKELSARLPEGAVLVTDAGNATPWMSQAFEFKLNQRLISAYNNFPMGYALPAGIGACFALVNRPVVCVTGDGSVQMNIHELATLVEHDLPMKIFVLNNHGYAMIQQTQDQWFDSQYVASSVGGGLASPDLTKIAAAYGLDTVTIDRNRELGPRIAEVLASEGAVLCNVEIPLDRRVIPQVKFGRPIEDSEPLLARKEFVENMIVRPMESSLE